MEHAEFLMVEEVVGRAFRGGCFFVAPPWRLRVERADDESVPWEIFRGHLLDAAQAGASERFTAWHVFLDAADRPGAAPLASVRWQRAQQRVYVTRQILSHAFEAYEDTPGVILTRPVQKWMAELVGVIEIGSLESGALTSQLGRLLFQAVVGTSRLPITSLESPLVEFSLSRLAYLPELSDQDEPWRDPVAFLAAALRPPRPLAEQAKALEVVLRGENGRLTDRLVEVLKEHGAVDGLFRALFNGVALSPYTHFADALIGLIVRLADAEWFGRAAALDAIGTMLRHLCRHLTAFDLRLFHNFGANYPDALFLDALVRAYVKLIERDPGLVQGADATARLRRRALRQACLLRRHYEGHRVPDAPTSMGENLRVLPAPFVRVPEEQILQTGKRKRKLFESAATSDLLDEPGRRALATSLADLDIPAELRELGMAQFLDRPLGALKEPGEVDQTPLLSYEAFSRSIARRRVAELAAAGWIDAARRDALNSALTELPIVGVPIMELSPRERPGVVSIADAAIAAADFVLLRTTRSSLDELLSQFDLCTLGEIPTETHAWLTRDRDVLLVQHVPREDAARPVLRAYRRGELRLQLPLT